MQLPRLISIICGVGVAASVAASAYAQTGTPQSKSSLSTEISTQFQDNTTGAITPFKLRQVTQDMVASWQQYTVQNSQSGTTYTVLASDYGKIVNFTNALAVAVTLPVATGLAPFNVYVRDVNSSLVTFTPVAGTINGNANYSITTGMTVWIVSDGSNWTAIPISGGAGGGSSGPIIIGSTQVIGGAINDLLSVSSNVVAAVAPAANCLYLTDNTSTPSCATTLANLLTLSPPININGLNISGYLASGALAPTLMDLGGTWNTSNNPTALNIHIIDTADGGSALLMKLSAGAAGSTVEYSVDKSGNVVQNGTLTAANLSTVGSIGGSLCATSAGLVLYESGVNCFTVASSITANSTTTSGFAAGEIPYSDGSKIQINTALYFNSAIPLFESHVLSTDGEFDVFNTQAAAQAFTVALRNAQFSASRVAILNTGIVGWCSVGAGGGDCASSSDTGLSRDGAGVVDIGNGVQGDISGSLKVSTVTLGATAVFASSTTGGGTQTFTNSPCTTSLTSARWIPVTITGQSGTWKVPACQ